jgi:RHS repeat-associated protein
MKLKYILICLLASISVANAQYQNYDIETPDGDSKTYIGRDYVRLLPGYNFAATAAKTATSTAPAVPAKSMNAKVGSSLSTTDAGNFLAVAIPAGGTPDAVTAIDQTKAVGQIPISSSVSPGGAKCYNVPIEIVPGRLGFQPNISLSYNSQAGNGVVGMGWGISGLSAIERVNKNVFYDGVNDIPALKSTDAFVLDGVRLIKADDSFDAYAANEICLTTANGNIAVTAFVNGDIVKYFKVQYPNGTVGVFGYDTNTTSKLSYPLTKLTDINGSIITFLYTLDDADLNSGKTNEVYYIKEIDYGQCKNQLDFAKIVFTNVTRTDQVFSLQSSKSCVYRQILSKIESFANSGIIRTYQLAYSNADPRITSNQNDVSRLTQISSFVNAGTATTDNLNPLKFYYGEGGNPSIIKQETALAYTDLSKVNFIRGKFDVNSQNEALLMYPKASVYTSGDHNESVPSYPSGNDIKVYQSLSTLSKINTPFKAEDRLLDIKAANIDGKGLDEVVKINSDGGVVTEVIKFKIYKSSESLGLALDREEDVSFDTWISDTYLNSSDESVSVYSVDPKKFYTGNFTGKGVTEILIVPLNNPISVLNLNVESPSVTKHLYSGSIYLDYNLGWIYPMDTDGDGQTEIAYISDNNTTIYKYKEGYGFVSVGTWALKKNDFGDKHIFFSDLNGDGKVDIIESPKTPTPYLKTFTYSATKFEVGAVVKCPNCGFITDGTATVCMKNNMPSFTGGKANYRQFFTSSHDPLLITQKCVSCNMNFQYYKENNDHTYCVWCNQLITSLSGCSTHGVIVTSGPYSSTVMKYSNYSYSFKSPSIYDYTYDNNWRYMYSDGVSIKKDVTKTLFDLTLNQNYYIQDVDGDNIPELVVNNNGTVQFYPFSPKDLSFVNTPLSATFTTHLNSLILPIDINSDIRNQELLVLDYYSGVQDVHFSKSHISCNQMSLMVNSLGVTDKTSYDQLYQGANYTPGTAASFPNVDFQGPLWVATQNSTLYNKQVIANNTYAYTGAILHKQGLGLRGFTTMTATDLMTNKKATTEFNPYQMGAVIHQTSDNAESAFTYSFTDYDRTKTPIQKMQLLLTGKIVTDKLKKNTATTTYSGYDGYGNVGTEATDFGGGIKSTVASTYFDHLDGISLIGSKYFIGFPLKKETTLERDTKTFTQSESYVYNTDYRLQYARKYIGSKLASETEYTYFPYPYNYLPQYETVHNVITKKSTDDLTTTYAYDTDNCSLLTKKNPQGLVTTFTNDLTKRLLTGVTDYLNNTVTYGYNDWRQKTSEVSTVGSVVVTTTLGLTWNTSESEPKRLIQQTTSTTGQPSSSLYADALGRETRKSVVGFDGTSVNVDKEYDNYGRLKNSSAPYKSGESPLLTTYSYDQYNRPEKVLQPNGGKTSYSYSGNSVTENKDGISVTKTTDVTGKLVSSTDAGGTVSYTYRPDGQPESVNTEGVVTSFEYVDDYNRQTKLIDPSAGTVQTAYDDANHTVTQTWNGGKNIATVSNKFGQPTSKTTKDLINTDITTTYGYDTYGRPTGSTSTNSTAKSIDYDTNGRLWKSTETVSGKTYQEVYGYDNGRIGSITYNTNTGANTLSYPVYYNYNTYGYLYQLIDNAENVLRQVNNVNSLGMETDVLLGNGLTTTKHYTPEGLWTNVKTYNKTDNNTIRQNMDFDFNHITGVLNSRSDVVHGLSEGFGYDNMYRLKTFGSGTMDYAANGNISTKSDAGELYNYPDATKPYTLSKVTNANTDLTSTLKVDYTVLSRPTSITNETGTLSAAFTYNDAYDRAYMQQKVNGIESMSKTYFAGGKYEIETVGGIEKQRLYLDGSPYTASILLEKAGTGSLQTYYLHRDYLGSITQITDNSANLAAEYSYDAWGRMRDITNWQVYGATAQPTPMFGRGYTGHEHLNQFGLINMNARLYDPILARFLAPDPFVGSGMTNDFNRYIYGRNNPMMYTDPSGKSFKDWWKKNVSEPFSRAWNERFGNGQGGWQIGYNSSGGFFTNPTYNGAAFGPSAYFNPSNKQFDIGTGSGGWHDRTSSIRIDNKIAQSVVSAEQNAKEIYYQSISFASNYNNQLNSWVSQHIIFESELRFDYGAQIAGRVKGFGGELGFNVQKDVAPFAQADINYNGGWEAAIYDKASYSSDYIKDMYRTSWSAGLGVGMGRTYYPTKNFFEWGDMESEKIYWGVVNVTKLFDYKPNCYERQFTSDWGGDFSFLVGVHINLRFGYKY